MARTTPEKNQKQEGDDTSLVLDNIDIQIVNNIRKVFETFASTKTSIYKNDVVKKNKMLSLARDATKVVQFRNGIKGVSRGDAHAAMSRLLTEAPLIPTASLKMATFLSEIKRIKQSNPEQGEAGPSGS